jgi:hypothetical protein
MQLETYLNITVTMAAIGVSGFFASLPLVVTFPHINIFEKCMVTFGSITVLSSVPLAIATIIKVWS